MSQAVGRDAARRRAEDGVALVVVVLLTLGVTAVLVAMLVGSNTEHMVAANERDSERALLASKAGLNYAYSLYANGLIVPSTSCTAFNSFATSVAASLDGAAFAGRFHNVASGGTGQTYRIVSTGTYNRGSRTTELVFQLVCHGDLQKIGFETAKYRLCFRVAKPAIVFKHRRHAHYGS